MKKNFNLFTWEEKYLMFEELRKWKKLFWEKHWKENVFVYDSDNFNFKELENSFLTDWFFSSWKKMFIIYWLPNDLDIKLWFKPTDIKRLEDFFIKKINWVENEDIIVVFVCSRPDKRWKFYKFLLDKITIKNFEKYNDKKLDIFMEEYLWISLNIEIKQNLKLLSWDNMFSLVNSLSKIKILLKYNKIRLTNDDILSVVTDNSKFEWFEIVDIFNDFEQINNYLDFFRYHTKSYKETIWIIFRAIRQYIFVMEQINLWIKDFKLISQNIWAHPFQVAKILKRIWNRWDFEKMKKLFEEILQTDFNVVSWKIHEEMFWISVKNAFLEYID